MRSLSKQSVIEVFPSLTKTLGSLQKINQSNTLPSVLADNELSILSGQFSLMLFDNYVYIKINAPCDEMEPITIYHVIQYYTKAIQ